MSQPSPNFDPFKGSPAARRGTAAGVTAWAGASEGDCATEVIHRNLVELLPTRGEPGVLAELPEPSSVGAVASKLATRLLDDIAKDAMR